MGLLSWLFGKTNEAPKAAPPPVVETAIARSERQRLLKQRLLASQENREAQRLESPANASRTNQQVDFFPTTRDASKLTDDEIRAVLRNYQQAQGGEDPIESLYKKMARDLRAQMGHLERVEFLNHYPLFDMNLVFEKGNLYSGARTGEHDINFLRLGYVGEGPRYARQFLSELGFTMSGDQIASIRAGARITLSDGRVVVEYPNPPPQKAASSGSA